MRIAIPSARLLLAFAIACGAVATAGCGGQRTLTPEVPPAAGLPKPPPAGAVVTAKQVGELAVALAATPPQNGRTDLTVTVLGPKGTVDGLHVSFVTSGETVAAQSCGSGCYTAAVDRPHAVTVRLAGRARGSVTFEVPRRLPVPSAAALVRRATAAYDRLRSVTYVERLSSGPGNQVISTWKQVAPNRFEYRIRGGAAGILIGATRWDKPSPRARWISSQTQALRVPTPIWAGGVTNAHLLRTEKRGGRTVDVVSLFNRQIPAWFTIRLERRTLHPVTLDMVAASHFMHHDYRSFNRPLKVVPP